MLKPRVFVTRRIAAEALVLVARETDMELWVGDEPPPRSVMLEEVRRSDGLLTMLTDKVDASLHVALTPDTRHFISRDQLHMMKRDAVLINTARGDVVDQKALYQALKEGVIAGAALDVAEEEPVPMREPLLTLPNVLITPHIASATLATRTRMAVMAAQNLIAGLKSEPMPHCLNPEAIQRRQESR